MVTPMMSHEKIIEQKIGHEKKFKKKNRFGFMPNIPIMKIIYIIGRLIEGFLEKEKRIICNIYRFRKAYEDT